MSYDPEPTQYDLDALQKEKDQLADVNTKLREQIKALQAKTAAQAVADAKDVIAEAESLLSKTDKQRVAIIRNILADLEAANGPMNEKDKGMTVNGLLDLPTANLVALRDLSLRRKAQQTAAPTDSQVTLITEKLLEKPQVAFAVAQALMKANLAGPWQLGPRGCYRDTPHDRRAATVEAQDSNDTPPMTVWVPGLDISENITAKSYAAGMDKADEILRKRGIILVGDRPFKVVTPWWRGNGGKEGVARYARLHDVPSVATKLPLVVQIEGPDPTVGRDRWLYTLTLQAMIDVVPLEEATPITGLADSLEEAQDAADKWLLEHGWMVP